MRSHENPCEPSSPFPRQAFQYLVSAENKHWWFRARNQIIIWIVKSRARCIKDFLEVGCGTGYVISGIAKAIPGLRLEATEYFEDGLIFARQRAPECRFRQLDATSMNASAPLMSSSILMTMNVSSPTSDEPYALVAFYC